MAFFETVFRWSPLIQSTIASSRKEFFYLFFRIGCLLAARLPHTYPLTSAPRGEGLSRDHNVRETIRPLSLHPQRSSIRRPPRPSEHLPRALRLRISAQLQTNRPSSSSKELRPRLGAKAGPALRSRCNCGCPSKSPKPSITATHSPICKSSTAISSHRTS